MAFPFSNWFKSKPGTPNPEADAADRPAPVPIPPLTPRIPVSSSGVTRTVTPNSVQPVKLHEPQSAQPRGPITLPTGNAGRTISFSGSAEPAVAAPSAPAMPRYQPQPAVVGAMPEVTISLELGDFLDRLPTNFLQPGPFDRHLRVDFLASELYSDLSRGRATVPASVIYQKCPQVFARPISDTEDVEVHLPLHKLVEQLGTALQPRTDQVAEENVTEIETPFLQVAMEDNQRLSKAPGTSMGATIRPMGIQRSAPAAAAPPPAPRAPNRTGQILPISPIKLPADQPAMPIAPPTAQSTGPIMSSKRPPSTVRASVAGGKIRLSGPAVSSRSFSPATNPPVPASDTDAPATENSHSSRSIPLPPPPLAASPSHQVTKKTARIQIPPISLRPAGAGSVPGPRPPAPDTPSVQPSPVPIRQGPEPLTNFKVPSPGVPAPSTFRSTPPPSAKPVPSSFSPLRPAFPTPVFPAAPPRPPAPGLTASSALPFAPAETAPAPMDMSGPQTHLGLAAILRAMPAPALEISPSDVPADVQVSLPFAMIESQLSNGRVTVPLDIFLQAVPENYRHAFAADGNLTEVPIPLQEVFQHLPANALSRRADQIIEEVGNHYPTPFSQRAEEDAQRFGGPVSHAPAVDEPTAPTIDFKPAPTAPLAPPTESENAAPAAIPAPLVEEPAAESPAPVEAKATTEPSHHEETAPLRLEEEESSAAIEGRETEESPQEVPAADPLPITNEPDAAAPTEARADAPAPADSPVAIELPPIPVAPVAEQTQSQMEEFAPVPFPEITAEPVNEQLAEEPAVASEPVAAELPSESAEATTPQDEASAAPIELPPLGASADAALLSETPTNEAENISNDFAPSVAPLEAEQTEPPVAAHTESIEEEAQTEEQPAAKLPELRDIQTPAPFSAPPADTELQTLFMTEDDLDAKTIVRLVSHLPGIEACTVMFGDGLLLAGNFPADGDTEGFSAMAPPFYQRALNFAGELALGELQTFTLYTDQGLTSFFMHEDICLSVRHAGRGFMPGVREKLNVVTRELAKMYGAIQPSPTHSPHHG